LTGGISCIKKKEARAKRKQRQTAKQQKRGKGKLKKAQKPFLIGWFN
jgi:hypothetical protein